MRLIARIATAACLTVLDAGLHLPAVAAQTAEDTVTVMLFGRISESKERVRRISNCKYEAGSATFDFTGFTYEASKSKNLEGHTDIVITAPALMVLTGSDKATGQPVRLHSKSLKQTVKIEDPTPLMEAARHFRNAFCTER